ncbi:Eco57I restriction-modification methylase domain-containing protein [Cellulomonas marina]|nr:N-6 DNA methylase [Cellulomonas marina]
MMTALLERAEGRRIEASTVLESAARAELGQFFTPASAAALIARTARVTDDAHTLRILDPGSGSGMLTTALVARVLAETSRTLHIVAVERDPILIPFLNATLEDCTIASNGRMTYQVIEGDYIELATGTTDSRLLNFDVVIQNPPYRKLASSSAHRRLLRDAGVDAPNLYAAFLALGTQALKPGGQLVAITPRSFANGPHFGAFRHYLLDQVSFDRVHIFESRAKVFADTGVLQDNIIFSATKGGAHDSIVLSVSSDHENNVVCRTAAYSAVVHVNDPHRFIRLATTDADDELSERFLSLPATLDNLTLEASTGRVVDFRSRASIRETPQPTSAPLIYPGNLRAGRVNWPRTDIRKPQWFEPETARDNSLLMPSGWYCVVKRFSAKEERRRIVAAVWSPTQAPGPVAFENHLNVFHSGGAGIDESTAKGLCLWLNSTLVDRFFRTFSGHTQVNATDLRSMRYPDATTLRRLGAEAPSCLPSQTQVDNLVESALTSWDLRRRARTKAAG